MSRPLYALFLSALLLTGCAGTSDRYAFWRDSAPDKGGAAPNLGDVPSAPDTQSAKAEMETMRQRLEIERQNAFRAADGLPPLPGGDAPMDNNMATDTTMMAPPAAPAAPMPDMMPPQQQTWQSSSNVQINPMPGSQPEYVYGNSPVQVRQNMAKMPSAPVVSPDPSISIDMSVLDTGTSTEAYISPLSMNSGEAVAFFGHGSASIDRSSRQHLRSLAEKIQRSNSPVVLVGHASHRTGVADPIASQMINLRMSAKRAETVLQELSRHGVAASKIKITALGDSQPNPNASGKRKEDADRRVEVLFDQ